QKPLVFSSLDLTDDDAYLGDIASVQKLGEIKLEIWRVQLGETTSRFVSRGPPKDRKVHERTKKAGSHSVKLGDEVPCTKTRQRNVVKLDRVPVVTFIFRYNPIEVLRANGIAPLAPVPRPAAPSADSKDVDVKPKRKGVALNDDIIDLTVEVVDNKTKKVKQEPGARDRKAVRSGEIIDLT
ncbi:hypothetical protein GLOTRDRAFT_135285, partial [Gloeophyllum trabeum ATCC 11539]